MANKVVSGSVASIASTLGSVLAVISVAPSPQIFWPAIVLGGGAVLGNILALFGAKSPTPPKSKRVQSDRNE